MEKRTRVTRLLGLFTLACVSAACSDEPTAVDTTPPGAIPSLAATVTGGSVRLSWQKPPDRDVAGTLVVRFPAAGVSGAPETGRSYAVGGAVGSGQAIFTGDATEATDSPPCREHVYGAWARDAAGNWSANARTARVTGLPGSALPAAPTSLSATVDAAGIALSWTLTGAAPASMRVVRKRGSPPAGVGDGDVVFAGTGTAARDAAPELNPLVTLHYAAFACNPCGDCEPTGARASLTPTLTQALRAGGYVLFWRHATANTCQDRQELGRASMPQIVDWWKSCDRNCATALARQLDQQGYDEADAIGGAIRTRMIPFSRVLSSEYCRSVETAAHMALGPPTETFKDITFYVYFPEIDACVAFPKLLAVVPSAGSNTAIVAHTFAGCTDGIASAEAWIYRPDGKGGSTLIAKVKANEWAGLPS